MIMTPTMLKRHLLQVMYSGKDNGGHGRKMAHGVHDKKVMEVYYKVTSSRVCLYCIHDG